MARIALATGPGGHPADLGPCSRTRVTADEVRAALAAAGHQVVDAAPDLAVADVAAAAPTGTPLVLMSVDRPLDPWQAIADATDRQAFIEPWAADLANRKRAALARPAEAYADSLDDLVAAIHAVLHPVQAEPPALRYLGALFNRCTIAPGTSYELDLDPRPLVLGRGQGADVVVPTAQLARAHLQMAVTDDHGLTITDLGSTNGTWICQPDGEVVELTPGAPFLARRGALVMPDGSFRFLVA